MRGFKGSISISASALFLSLTCLPAHSQVVADSLNDFTGTQGLNNWYYGYFLSSNLRPAGFTQLEAYSAFESSNFGFGWNHGNAWPTAPYTRLGYAGGWPNGASDDPRGEEWAVRRWVSEVDGPVTVSGELRKTPGNTAGDGVFGQILIDGAIVYSQSIAGSDTTGLNYSFQANVQMGSLVDFVLRPYQTTGNGVGDASVFTGIVTVPEPQAWILLLLGGGAFGILSSRPRRAGGMPGGS